MTKRQEIKSLQDELKKQWKHIDYWYKEAIKFSEDCRRLRFDNHVMQNSMARFKEQIREKDKNIERKMATLEIALKQIKELSDQNEELTNKLDCRCGLCRARRGDTRCR